jgi:hypothetical protein
VTEKLITLGVPVAGKDWNEQYLIGHLAIDFMLDHADQTLSQSIPRMLFQVLFVFVKLTAKACIAVFPFAVACLYSASVLESKQGWIVTAINVVALSAVILFWIDMYRHENILRTLEMKEKGGEYKASMFKKFDKDEQP